MAFSDHPKSFSVNHCHNVVQSQKQIEKSSLSMTSKRWRCNSQQQRLLAKIFFENFTSVQLTKFPLIIMQLKSEQIVNVITF